MFTGTTKSLNANKFNKQTYPLTFIKLCGIEKISKPTELYLITSLYLCFVSNVLLLCRLVTEQHF